jgi:GAF domain-containing protein
MDADVPDHSSELIEQLQRLIQAIDASGRTILLRTDSALLQSIVEAAARIFGAAAAAIALLTDDGQELEFQVAYNVINQNIVGMRVPVNKGIAGYVALTGQPMAVSNVEEESRFNRDFAEQSGYVPKSILAVPLVSGGRTIGVIEVLDKIDAQSFGLQDIELLGLFARQAALAIHQSQQLDHLEEALIDGLKKLAADPNDPSPQFQAALQQRPAANDDLRRLAAMINEISSLGKAEQTACLQVLSAFQTYSRTKTAARPDFSSRKKVQ